MSVLIFLSVLSGLFFSFFANSFEIRIGYSSLSPEIGSERNGKRVSSISGGQAPFLVLQPHAWKAMRLLRNSGRR
jgi:hypothetical protein